jgi:hypothetical protein
MSLNLIISLRGWLIFALHLLLCPLLCAESGKYRGFTIDESRVRNAPNLEEIRAATREQIDIVCAVGLPADMLQFLQTVPFVFLPAETVRAASPGLYRAQDRSVSVTSRILAIGRRPVLLHELMHAYHDQRLPQGFKNPAILRHFEHAKAIGGYAASSHMMRNSNEFFACAATTYLFGVTAQEPFKRDAIKERQPELFAHLQTLFGPDTGSYAGSLTR